MLRAFLFVLLSAGSLHAQSSPDSTRNREGPTTIMGSVGAWSTGHGPWPRVGVAVDHALGAFIPRVELWAVSRPEVLCSDGVHNPMCDERRLIRGISVGARLQERDGRWHPYIGAGGGGTKYYRRGAIVFVEAGMRYDIESAWGVDVRGSLEILGEGDSVGGADVLNIGVWYVVRK